MKTNETKNRKDVQNFTNDIIQNRKTNIQIRENQSSEYLVTTLKKLSATNLYAATDAGPFKNRNSFKVSPSA